MDLAKSIVSGMDIDNGVLYISHHPFPGVSAFWLQRRARVTLVMSNGNFVHAHVI